MRVEDVRHLVARWALPTREELEREERDCGCDECRYPLEHEPIVPGPADCCGP
jgi:hypothetical protein